jgi:phosphate transport system protein
VREQADPLDWLADEQRQAGSSQVEFPAQLAACREKLVGLASEVAVRVIPVTEALLDADVAAARAHSDLHRRVAEGCAALEDACLLLLARQSPVGGDLRLIVAMIRSVTPVERGASLVAHIARTLTWVHPPSLAEPLRETLDDLAHRAAEIYAGAIQAWESLDGRAAAELQQRDDEVDLLQKLLLTELYTGEQSTEESVSLALIARYFERLSDHGVDMARQVAYAVTGERLADEDA